MIRWSDLPSHLRGILIAAVLITAAVGVGAFTLSFDAQRDWAEASGLFTQGKGWIFPLVVDGALVGAELFTAVAVIIGAAKFGPAVAMILFGGVGVWVNLMHAAAETDSWAIRATAAIPPAGSIVMTLLIAWAGKHIARALGKPLTYTLPQQPVVGMLGPNPGVIYQPNLAQGGMLPPGYPYAMPQGYIPAIPAAQHVPEDRHTGQAGMPANGNGNAVQVDDQTKLRMLEEHLSGLNAEQLQATTASEVRKRFAEAGIEVSERYIQPVLQRVREEKVPRKWPGRKQRERE